MSEFSALSSITNCPINRLFGGTPAVTVRVSVKLLLASAVDVAVMVTVLPAGTATGAVKVVVEPLAVCVGEKEPQAGALPQVTVQSTPALAGSLLTVATKGALAF